MSRRLTRYRSPLATEGDPHVYAGWIRDLRGRSGVYVLRSGSEVVYIGESHTGRLYRTLTRHWQGWTGATAGTTYDPADLRVAVLVCSSSCAVEEQRRLIERHKPADNAYLKGGDDSGDVDPTEFSDAPPAETVGDFYGWSDAPF